MVQREPEKRLTAEEYLKRQRGKAFPDIFYTFLQPYMAQFAKETFQSADERVLVIRKDLDNILHNLRGGDRLPMTEKLSAVSQTQTPPPAGPSSSLSQEGGDCVQSSREEQGLIVLVSVITSCLQTLHSCDSKLAALELVLHLAPRLGVDILLDRITPYLLHFCNDPVPRVRAQAVRTLAKVLALVKEVPRNDVNIYPEYILPGIAHLAQDDATIVRLAYAGQSLIGWTRRGKDCRRPPGGICHHFLFQSVLLKSQIVTLPSSRWRVQHRTKSMNGKPIPPVLILFSLREHRPSGGERAAFPGAGPGKQCEHGTGRERRGRRGNAAP